MSVSVFLFFVLGLVALVVGADALVAGASRLAARVGISPLVVGLTVVAFGTSAPEFAVSLTGALQGQADLALGNVVGSNLFNVLLILGVTAVIAPLPVQRQLIRVDVPLMIGCSALCWLFALDGTVGRLDGVLLAAGLLVYTAVLIWQSRREHAKAEAPASPPARGLADRIPVQLLLIAAGLALLVVGSRWLVGGAIALAESFGVSELVISLTIVAAGTSLPELATSALAAARGQRDIAVGNIVGSNIFNLLSVLGLTAAIAPDGVAVAPQALEFDIPAMAAVALLCLPLFMTGQIVTRWEGALLVALYVAYTAYLLLAAWHHPWFPDYTWLMTRVAVPTTAVVVTALLVRDLRRRRAA